MSDPSDPITRLNAALEGRYRIEREIGEGGMATVYLAQDERHERKVLGAHHDASGGGVALTGSLLTSDQSP